MKTKLTEGKIKKALEKSSPVVENSFRHYSVLIPIIKMKEGFELLYEVRGKKLDRQPGEICFPGGEVEDGESFARCALRETREEIGIAEEDIRIGEELTTIYGVGRFAMHCFPGFISEKAMKSLDLNEEVEEVFTVPLEILMDREVEMYRAKIIQEGPEDFPYERITGEEEYPWSRFTSPVPVYDVGDRIIWGLTGRATKVLLDVLKEV